MATPTKEATAQVPASKVKFFDTTLGKTLKTTGFVVVSAAVGYWLSAVQGNPALFGVYTPIVNIVLVAIKNLVDPNVKDA